VEDRTEEQSNTVATVEARTEEQSNTVATVEARREEQSNTVEDRTEDQSNTVATVEARRPDQHFEQIFLKNKTTYSNHGKIDRAVEEYQDISGFRIVIRRAAGDARMYFCGSHKDCCFRAKFGKVQGTDRLALKEENTTAFHCGQAVTSAKGGRSLKRRVKGKIQPSVNSVAVVKDGPPRPKDVMKAAANLHGITATYQQSYRAIDTTQSHMAEKSMRSFQLLHPYLQRFSEVNHGCTTTVSDAENHIQKLFVCPRFMDEAIRFVRPVMSLDAAHLKSKWKGTLYIASVKSACDEIFPVAFAITDDNENSDGWEWFLENLRSSLPTLVVDHPKDGVTYKYFTFISDRQKGLIQSLQKVFPRNHACFCVIHIARNVETKPHMGRKMSKYVVQLARTFSPLYYEELLRNVSESCRQYLESIPGSEWRNISWLENPALPPRYGILTSNMSESANSMFEAARDGSWMHTVDTILNIMFERISRLRQQHNAKTGVIEKVSAQVQKRWFNCAGYKVVELEENVSVFAIVCRGKNAGEEDTCLWHRSAVTAVCGRLTGFLAFMQLLTSGCTRRCCWMMFCLRKLIGITLMKTKRCCCGRISFLYV
jgi:hypothetical protein